jgi:hypothetical protein
MVRKNEERSDGKAERDGCHSRSLDRRVRHLADRAVLGVVGKIVGVEMEGLRNNRYAGQQDAEQYGAALS